MEFGPCNGEKTGLLSLIGHLKDGRILCCLFLGFFLTLLALKCEVEPAELAIRMLAFNGSPRLPSLLFLE